MDNIQIIERLVAEGKLHDAVDRLSEMLAETTGNSTTGGDSDDSVSIVGTDPVRAVADLYFRRGKLWWRLGNRSAATSDYAHAVALDPASPAVKALEHARDVADFFNPDLYNP